MSALSALSASSKLSKTWTNFSIATEQLYHAAASEAATGRGAQSAGGRALNDSKANADRPLPFVVAKDAV